MSRDGLGNRYVGKLLRQYALDLIRTLPPAKAQIVRRLLWIAEAAPMVTKRLCLKCKAPIDPASKSGRCSTCYLAGRKADAAPKDFHCPDCGGKKANKAVRCRKCAHIVRYGVTSESYSRGQEPSGAQGPPGQVPA